MAALRAAVDPVPAGSESTRGSASRERHSAVLVLADPAAAGVPLLLIRRSQNVSSHRGQIAFPGGGAEPRDDGIAGTALREAHEEVGVDPTGVEVIGALSSLMTNTSGRRVDPVVALARRPVEPTSGHFEVAEWFWVGLDRLLTAEVTSRAVPHGADSRPVVFIDLGDRIIWGATGAMIVDLIARVRAHLAPAGGQR